MSFQIRKGTTVVIRLEEKENSAVRIAAENLKGDLERALGARAEVEFLSAAHSGSGESADAGRQNTVFIQIHTADGCSDKEKLLPCTLQGTHRKEGYALSVDGSTLYITGADRRGTVYGIYDISRRAGVSPWYFFADVPDRQNFLFELSESYLFQDFPSVEYRGVFINDEEELEKWVKLHMGEDTIGVKTYEKIFELLLRLRGNYIWPAMHVNSFNVKRENGELADRMGIVVGTSHCDMLMRSNNREWKPWISKKGYTDVEYDYSIPGRNREILDEYWRESVEQNKDFEVGYTLGMRGIHDSGFETKTLKGLAGKELLDAKIELLQTVIQAQERILDEVLKEKDQLKTFVPYKEVLELYDNGLEVPEDLTLIWANDNYGHIRRYPGDKEKKRKGGNGIYYHNSYWAPPGASYLFTKSIPIAQTKNELKKAWNEGIRKLWVLNIGALKPLEIEISFYLQYAWEIGKEKEGGDRQKLQTLDTKEFLARFFDGMFTNEKEQKQQGKKLAELYTRWAQLTNVRKVEQLDSDAFSQNAYGNEASERMLELQEIRKEADAVYESLPEREKDAFFQIVLWRIHASYISNAMYYYADRSAYCNKNGMYQAAAVYAGRSVHYDEMRRKLLHYYANGVAEGKWSGIVTPEDFPPPRTAMYPAYVFPREIGNSHMIVKCFGEEDGLKLANRGFKWITIFNAGEGRMRCAVKAPEYVELYECETDGFENRTAGNDMVSAAGEVINLTGNFGSGKGDGCLGWTGSWKKVGGFVEAKFETRILVRVKEGLESGFVNEEDEIVIACSETGEEVKVPLVVDLRNEKEKHAQDCGIICVEAVDYECVEEDNGEEASSDSTGWNRIACLGRGYGDLMESGEKGRELRYSFYLKTPGSHMLEIHRFPSLNSTGDIQAFVQVDNGGKILVKTEANDEWRGNWKENVRDGVDRLYVLLPGMEEGRHVLSFYSDSPYFAFSRFVIYTGERKENMMGRMAACPVLYGEDFSQEHFFYEKEAYDKRPAIYAAFSMKRDSLLDEDRYIRVDSGNVLEDSEDAVSTDSVDLEGRIRLLQEMIGSGKNIFAEENGKVCIDAVAALSETEFARTKNAAWDYCGGFSHGERGAAMHIRKTGLSFGPEENSLPALEYQFQVTGGEYALWILLKYNSYGNVKLKLSIDGKKIPDEECNLAAMRKYSAEQVFRWVPLCKKNLEEGAHRLEVGIYTSDMRIDSISFVKGDALP